MGSLEYWMFVVHVVLLTVEAAPPPRVIIDQGVIIGSRNNVSGVWVNTFLGIPYAKKPVGHLRFRKPVPLPPSPLKEHNATSFGDPCPQASSSLPLPGVPSEDCLYLNIWVPQNSKENTLKQVLVYFHPGAFLYGTASGIDLSILAGRTDFVVVTANYRLGALGFLYSGTDDAPGNVALHDQYLFLRWTRKYIAHFGGDPNTMTVAGTSAGGMSVSLHLLSPLSRSLFVRAAMFSGVALDNTAVESIEKAKPKLQDLAKRVGCSDQMVTRTDVALKCLKKVDFRNIVQEENNHKAVERTGNPMLINFMPVYGDSFLPWSPLDGVKFHKYQKHIPILFTNVLNEGSLIEQTLRDEYPAQWNNCCNTLQEFERKLVFYYSKFLTHDLSKHLNVRGALLRYFGGAENDNSTKLRARFDDAVGDPFFACMSSVLADVLCDQNPVYRYTFSFPSNVSSLQGQAYTPTHTSDGFYFFGLVPEVYSDVSNKYIDLIASFVKGNPPIPRAYRPLNSPFCTVPYYNFNPGAGDGPVNKSFRRKKCDFWKRTLYKEYYKFDKLVFNVSYT